MTAFPSIACVSFELSLAGAPLSRSAVLHHGSSDNWNVRKSSADVLPNAKC